MERVSKRWCKKKWGGFSLKYLCQLLSVFFFKEFYYCDVKSVVDSILWETKAISFAILSSYCKVETGSVIFNFANPHSIPISVVCVALMLKILRHSFQLWQFPIPWTSNPRIPQQAWPLMKILGVGSPQIGKPCKASDYWWNLKFSFHPGSSTLWQASSSWPA